MAATLPQLVHALADTIRTGLAGVTDIDIQVEPYRLTTRTTPSIEVFPSDPSIDPDIAAFGDLLGGELLTVQAAVSMAERYEGQNLLLSFMDDGDDPLSLATAIVSDTTLNGLASTVDLRGRSGQILVPELDGAGVHLGCHWTVEVVKARS